MLLYANTMVVIIFHIASQAIISFYKDSNIYNNNVNHDNIMHLVITVKEEQFVFSK